MSIIGLLELEAGLSASVLKPWVKTPKPKVNIIKDATKPPSSRAIELMEKYKVKQKEACSLSISLKFYMHTDYQLWFHRPSGRSRTSN